MVLSHGPIGLSLIGAPIVPFHALTVPSKNALMLVSPKPLSRLVLHGEIGFSQISGLTFVSLSGELIVLLPIQLSQTDEPTVP